MCYSHETGVCLRATLTELSGHFEQEDWETKCALHRRHVRFIYCQSLYDYCNNPVPQGCEDKRLEIDSEGLRGH
eukprot:3044257-Karenia_brevis.AAC.1